MAQINILVIERPPLYILGGIMKGTPQFLDKMVSGTDTKNQDELPILIGVMTPEANPTLVAKQFTRPPLYMEG